jgi:hypothetical protein
VNILDEEDRRAPDWRDTPAIANLALLIPEMKGKHTHTHTHTHTKQTHFPAKPSVKRVQLFSSGPRVSTPPQSKASNHYNFVKLSSNSKISVRLYKFYRKLITFQISEGKKKGDPLLINPGSSIKRKPRLRETKCECKRVGEDKAGSGGGEEGARAFHLLSG